LSDAQYLEYVLGYTQETHPYLFPTQTENTYTTPYNPGPVISEDGLTYIDQIMQQEGLGGAPNYSNDFIRDPALGPTGVDFTRGDPGPSQLTPTLSQYEATTGLAGAPGTIFRPENSRISSTGPADSPKAFTRDSLLTSEQKIEQLFKDRFGWADDLFDQVLPDWMQPGSGGTGVDPGGTFGEAGLGFGDGHMPNFSEEYKSWLADQYTQQFGVDPWEHIKQDPIAARENLKNFTETGWGDVINPSYQQPGLPDTSTSYYGWLQGLGASPYSGQPGTSTSYPGVSSPYTGQPTGDGTFRFQPPDQGALDANRAYLDKVMPDIQARYMAGGEDPSVWQDWWRAYVGTSLGMPKGTQAIDPMRQLQTQLTNQYNPSEVFGGQFDFGRAAQARTMGLGVQGKQQAAMQGVQGAFDPLQAAQLRSRDAVVGQAQAAYGPAKWAQNQQYLQEAEGLFDIINKAELEQRIGYAGLGI
jgi:hypothetical protein